jgi:hypothetical protein
MRQSRLVNRDVKIGSPISPEEHLGTANGANRLGIDLEMAEVDCGGAAARSMELNHCAEKVGVHSDRENVHRLAEISQWVKSTRRFGPIEYCNRYWFTKDYSSIRLSPESEGATAE